MSASESPASATAALAAATASVSGGSMSRRPLGELPMPVIATRSSNLAAVSMGRTCRACPPGAIASSGMGPGRGPFGRKSGAKTGSHSSPAGSNRIRTRIPTATSSGATSTRFVITRTRLSSSMATDATTNGGGKAGSHGWWLTVHPTTVPSPLTSAGPSSEPWQ
jgi:hypothetical protein